MWAKVKVTWSCSILPPKLFVLEARISAAHIPNSLQSMEAGTFNNGFTLIKFSHSGPFHFLPRPGPEVIKHFSCSTQLCMEFQMLTKTQMLKNIFFSYFQTLRHCIYHANKCLNANNCWHFNIYEQDQFHVQLR